ncbi:hypothetical protein PV04_02279 [Phialophora macrospora]|uniref:Beta-lactamase-related domain-containing protein n=1 Tax=Phialophora macrospora TaxID=1851006 RepID=A0A0D2E6M9_9EURO|nr:hypothetical protein PV04_02279 [Phialophora macrospora]
MGWHEDAPDAVPPAARHFPAGSRWHILLRLVLDGDVQKEPYNRIIQEYWVLCSRESRRWAEGIAIHFEDLSSETGQQVQTLNLRVPCSESKTRERHESDASSAIPSNDITTAFQGGRGRFTVEGEEASSFIYPVGSYGKLFIALTWILLLKDKAFEKAHGVALRTRACVLYNANKGASYPEIWLDTEPTIFDLLVHVNGFAAMNEHLIAPDDTPLLSENEEFLRVAAQITKDKYGDSKEERFEYSNANYSFLGILLELITGKDLWLVVKEVIIDKLELKDTTFDIKTLKLKERERVLVDGTRVSADGTQSKVEGFNHLTHVVHYAPLGLRTSLRDLATINREILLALDGEGRLDVEKDHFKWFFAGVPMAPCGYRTQLGEGYGSERYYSESPNTYLFPEQYTPYHLGKLRTRDEAMNVAFRKAGYIDGFGCNVTLMPTRGIFLIVLGNSTGAIDTAFHISNLILQEALRLSDPVNIIKCAIEEGKLCRTILEQIEQPEELTQNSTRPAGDLAGTYIHERYGQGITVHEDGTIQFHTSTKTSSTMNLVHIGRDMVMVCRGKQGLSFETWSVWRDLRFEVQRSRNRLALVRPGAKYAYKQTVE